MKFESKYGIGEVCVYNEQPSPCSQRRAVSELLVKIDCVMFDDQGVKYQVENITGTGFIQKFVCSEKELVGDPEFDQDKGRYPEEE